MLAQAMSSTTAVMPKSRKSGAFASRWIELCPAGPATMPSSLALKRVIVCALIPVCSGASTPVTIGR